MSGDLEAPSPPICLNHEYVPRTKLDGNETGSRRFQESLSLHTARRMCTHRIFGNYSIITTRYFRRYPNIRSYSTLEPTFAIEILFKWGVRTIWWTTASEQCEHSTESRSAGTKKDCIRFSKKNIWNEEQKDVKQYTRSHWKRILTHIISILSRGRKTEWQAVKNFQGLGSRIFAHNTK